MAEHPSACCIPIENVLNVLGRSWAGAVLEAIRDGAVRFSQIKRAVPQVSDAVLSARLKELCSYGLVDRFADSSARNAVGYRLTPAGTDLGPVLDALRQYGETHPQLSSAS